MLRNYLKIIFRNFKKDSFFSIVNLGGLTVGIGCCILILMWIRSELSYDSFHSDADRIYRLVYDEHYQGETFEWAYSWSEWAAALQGEWPEIEYAARLNGNPNVPNDVIEYNGEVYREPRVLYADSDIFKIFDFAFLRGNPETALQQTNGVVLSEALAQKYFGDADPLGKLLLLNNQHQLQVTGVVAPWQENSHFAADLFISFKFFYRDNPEFSSPWVYTYLKLRDADAAAKLKANLVEIGAGLPRRSDFGEVELKLQAVTDIHLHSQRRGELAANGDMLYVHIFSFVALLILIVTCLNYINLSSAGSFKRFKEIGMRKTFGASRRHLALQFSGEAICFAFMALLLALLVLESLLPAINNYLQIAIEYGEVLEPGFLLRLLALTLATGLLAGLFPAVYLSSLRPIATLKGSKKAPPTQSMLRDSVVVAQFVLAGVLLASALVIERQVKYLLASDLGFAREQIVNIPIEGTPAQENFELFKQNLLQHADVVSVTASSTKPGVQGVWVGTFQPEGFSGTQRNWIVPHLIVEYDFLETYGIEVVAGRGFSRDHTTDLREAFMLNETAVRNLGWENPLGRRLQTWGDKIGHVIGVVKDFSFENLRQPVQPLVLHMSERYYLQAAIKIDAGNAADALAHIEAEWNKIAPALPMHYSFLDDDFRQLYQADVRMSRLTSIFTIFAVFFACLGLWGLTAFTIRAKRKEIGIRKVLGASIASVTALLSKDFVRLVLLANLIAWPLAWLAMNQWLQNFAYRIEISWWMFALAGGLALLIALVTVSAQAMRAALANPVESLRSE